MLFFYLIFFSVFISDSAAGYSEFMGSGQSLGSSYIRGMAPGDGDGDINAFVANYGQPNTVWVFNLCFCDIDEDGVVDEPGLAIFASEYGRTNCSRLKR